MQAKTFNLTRYDADEGMVFDYAEPRFIEDGEETIQQHLYASTLFIGSLDNILNYIEVPAPIEKEKGAD